MNMSPKMASAIIVAAGCFLAKWLMDDMSFGGFLLILIPVLLVVLAKHLPKLGMLIGGLLVSAPLWAWWEGLYDSSNFRSEGSAAGMVIQWLLFGLSAFVVWWGVEMIRAARGGDADYSEETGSN